MALDEEQGFGFVLHGESELVRIRPIEEFRQPIVSAHLVKHGGHSIQGGSSCANSESGEFTLFRHLREQYRPEFLKLGRPRGS